MSTNDNQVLEINNPFPEAEEEILIPQQYQSQIQQCVKQILGENGKYKNFFSVARVLLSAIVKLEAKLDPTAKKMQKIETMVQKEQKYETIYPSRKTRWVGKITKEQAKQKYEERKYIAFAFCQHGINYHYILQKYPDMPPKTYRCIVEAVNNQTVNQIVDYLRYECNVQIERLNRDQKRSIRTQMTKIKDWLGNKDPQQLETFYKFIYRHYDKQLEVKFEDALKLYKTIVQIIKSPFVNVLQAEEANKQGTEDQLKEEDKAILILFIKYRNEQKVTDQICQKYGYDKMEHSNLSIKMKLKYYLEATIEKLISALKADVQPIYRNYFNRTRLQLLERLPGEMKQRMYSYFLQKVTSAIKIKDLMLRLRQFYALQETELSEEEFPKTEKCDISFLTHSSSVKMDMEDTRQLKIVKSQEQTASESDQPKKTSQSQVKVEEG